MMAITSLLDAERNELPDVRQESLAEPSESEIDSVRSDTIVIELTVVTKNAHHLKK